MAQFVPLKIDTSTPEWQDWARKHAFEGGAIPIIYVVRSDGTKLYGKSGPLNGIALPQMMTAMLQQSGRTFNDQQILALESTVTEANQAHDTGDTDLTVKALLPVKKLGPLGELGSFAKAAVEADELVKEITEEGKTALASADEKLAAGQPEFADVLAYVEAKRIYEALPTLKTELNEVSRKHDRNPDLREVLAQAEAVDRARSLAKSPRSKSKGIDDLERIVARNPDTSAAEVALTELKKLLGDDYQPRAVDDSKPDFRTWTDTTGKFEVKAILLEVKDGAAVLKRDDGRVITVPLDKLSEADQEFVKSQE